MAFWVRNIIAGFVFSFTGLAAAATVTADYESTSATLQHHELEILKTHEQLSGATEAAPVPYAIWFLGLGLVVVAGVARHRKKTNRSH